jgi:hypothetical protein
VLLNKELVSKGIQVEHVLMRYFNYSKEIQKNIEEKKLKDQLDFKNIAEGIKTEGIATAKGIQEMNNAMAGSGGEALVKLRIAEAIQGKKIVLLPVSEGGMNLKTTDINRLIETMGIKALSKKQ